MDEKLEAILVEHFGCPIALETTFESLGADSLSMLDLLIAIETAYNIDIPDKDILRGKVIMLPTVGELQAYLTRRTCV